MDSSFEKFIKERRYLKNVSGYTEHWYRTSLRWLPNPNPTQSELNEVVIRMREAGLKPVSCNTYARAINAYLRWLGSPHKVAKMKEPQIVLPTFKPEDIQRFARWRPERHGQRRLQLLLLTLADTQIPWRNSALPLAKSMMLETFTI